MTVEAFSKVTPIVFIVLYRLASWLEESKVCSLTYSGDFEGLLRGFTGCFEKSKYIRTLGNICNELQDGDGRITSLRPSARGRSFRGRARDRHYIFWTRFFVFASQPGFGHAAQLMRTGPRRTVLKPGASKQREGNSLRM